MATTPCGTLRLAAELASAIATARSTEGSVSRTPPTVAAYTSCRPSLSPARRCRTASTMPTRAASSPEVVRLGTSSTDVPTRACTSAGSGRRPSSVTVTQVPDTGSRCWDRNSPLGSGSPISPYSPRSKHPTSSVGPYRFLTARTMRSWECRSPSKYSTTSTRCSRARGPATEPSLVTCPTRMVAIDRSLATEISALATARTWVTPPAEPSMSAAATVCTESMMSSPGSIASTCPSTASRSVSAARNSRSLTAPIRSARDRTWAADSSPVT